MAGGYLGRLRKRGLIRDEWSDWGDGRQHFRGYVLTEKGQQAPQEAEAGDGEPVAGQEVLS